MKLGAFRLAAGWLGACAIISAGLLFWPQAPTASPENRRTSAYGGVEHQLRATTTPSHDAVFVLSGSAQTAPTPQAASPALVGIVGRIAYLKSAASGATTGIAVGESLDGWKLAAVRGRTVTLEGPGGRHEASLFEKLAASSSNPLQDRTTLDGSSGTPP